MRYEKVIEKVDRYIASDKNLPILVDIPMSSDYRHFLQHYDTGTNKIIKANRYCNEDGMPLMDRLINDLSTLDEVLFLDELFYYLFLLGKTSLKNELRSLLDLSVKNKLVVLTLGCKRWIYEFDDRLFQAARILMMDGTPEELPSLYFLSRQITPPDRIIKGLGNLAKMRTLCETGVEDVPILTNKKKDDFPLSIYNIADFSSEFQMLSNEYAELANVGAIGGTNEQWGLLRKKLQDTDSFADYVTKEFGSTQALHNAINGFSKFDPFTQWVCFISLRVFGASGNDYLSKVISKSRTFDQFINNSFDTILLYSPEDRTFKDVYQQRKAIVSQMTGFVNELDSFCKQLHIKKKAALQYLTDNTVKEKEMTIELLCTYSAELSQAELLAILSLTYPDLAAYLQPFDYKNEFLNKYFQLYKWSKVTNRISSELLGMVEEQASERKYNVWFKPRSLVVDSLPKEKGKNILFFVDALGVEFLSYLQHKCYDNKLDFSADVARCELPSITSLNKGFVDDFKSVGCKVYSVKELDSLKHEGNGSYNYENTKFPIHIVEELNILNGLVNQLNILEENQIAYVISDHGATRLAVIAEKENKWEVSEKGKHSGRCCPKPELDEKPEFATEENNFWCLANYDRFKGGRAAIVEVHGGATLEEVAIPVISIRKQDCRIECKLVDDKPIVVSFKKKAQLKLYVSKHTDNLSVVINGKTYSSSKTETPYIYSFDLSDVKSAGIYNFNVLIGTTIIANNLSFEVKKEGASERKFF